MELEPNIEALKKKFAHILGWAHDADPENEPNYPYKHYNGDDHKRLNWDRPPLQEKTVEILHSTEHLRTPATFGTVAPPSGLSGVMRRRAYGYSENMLRHWLMLLMADRVDAVEGLIDDLRQGKLPRLGKERGFDALWEHNKQLMVRRTVFRAAVYGAVLGFVAYQLFNNKDPEQRAARRRVRRPPLVSAD